MYKDEKWRSFDIFLSKEIRHTIWIFYTEYKKNNVLFGYPILERPYPIHFAEKNVEWHIKTFIVPCNIYVNNMYTSKTSSDWRFNEIKHEHNVILSEQPKAFKLRCA